MLGRGASGMTATCGRCCPGASGVLSARVVTVRWDSPARGGGGVGWGRLPGVQDCPLGHRQVRRARCGVLPGLGAEAVAQ